MCISLLSYSSVGSVPSAAFLTKAVQVITAKTAKALLAALFFALIMKADTLSDNLQGISSLYKALCCHFVQWWIFKMNTFFFAVHVAWQSCPLLIYKTCILAEAHTSSCCVSKSTLKWRLKGWNKENGGKILFISVLFWNKKKNGITN